MGCFYVEIVRFSHQLCTLGLYVTSNVVKVMCVVLFQLNESHRDGD